MNLKETFMHLGNRLIARGHTPAHEATMRKMRGAHRGSATYPQPYALHDTHPDRLSGGLELIVLLTEWLNACPAAQEILAEMDIEWPTVDRKDETCRR